MENDRRTRLWGRVVAHAGGERVAVEHVCAVVVPAAGVDSAAVTVVLDDASRETVYAGDGLASEMEELSATLGEGPGADTVGDSPALVADLSAAEARSRWPVYGPAAEAAGVRAVFALPLRTGGIGLGVLCLYRALPGNLGREQLADALVLADTVLALLLDSGPAGRTGPDEYWAEEVRPLHPEVHQATGMIAAQLGVAVAVALVRLRAHAFAHDRRLSDVAKDVVARRLRFRNELPSAEGDLEDK